MHDDSEVRVAFCALLFEVNGGSTAGHPVVGKCDRPYDCLECPIMQQWLLHLEKTSKCDIEWECDQCIKDTFFTDMDNDVERVLPGYFQGSKYRGFPDEYELADESRVLDGCTTCGYGSPVLQLIIRRARK